MDLGRTRYDSLQPSLNEIPCNHQSLLSEETNISVEPKQIHFIANHNQNVPLSHQDHLGQELLVGFLGFGHQCHPRSRDHHDSH